MSICCGGGIAEERQKEYQKLKEDATKWAKKQGISKIAICKSAEGTLCYVAAGNGYPTGYTVLEFLSIRE